jgi:4-hydroxybenzoate polyprenyltransferase
MMTAIAAPLTARAGLARRLGAYLAERFPPARYGLLIASYYSSNQFLAQALAWPGEPVRYDAGSLLGAATLLCVFFHLRVIDDLKDYVDDCRHYPDRVLQQGIIALGTLRGLAGVAVCVEVLLGALRGWPALVAVLMVLGFSLLMRREFFLREWLRRHFLAYVTSHMLVIPLLALLVFSFTLRRYPWEAPGWFWVYAVVGFFVALNWEISRKIRAPEQEIEGVDSYTKRFGTHGAAYVVVAVRVADTALVALVGHHLGLGGWFYGVLVALFLACLIGFVQYRLGPSPATARRMELYAGLYILAFDVTLAAAIAGHVDLRL